MKGPIKILFCAFSILTIAFLAGCGNDHNNGGSQQTVTITAMTPNQVSIGQQHVQGNIAGTNLNGVTSVNLGNDIAVESVSGVSATQVNITFSVSGAASAGQRSITVTTSAGTATSSTLFSVLNNKVPLAAFTVDPKTGSRTTVFTFDASNSKDADGGALQFAWNFGDQKTAVGKVVKHKFENVGNFTVSLTVSDNNQAAGGASKQVAVSRNNPPTAKFTVKPALNGDTNTVFHFDASKSIDPAMPSRITAYEWNFGDGRKAKGIEVDHQFDKAGKFTVELTVTDNQGADSAVAEANLKVEKSTEVACQRGGNHPTFIRGVIVAVEPGQWAITNFGPGRTCANTFHRCDDFRRLSPENFYGIIDKMTYRGNGVFAVHNSCPYRWPPKIGERVFIYYKPCSNHCP